MAIGWPYSRLLEVGKTEPALDWNSPSSRYFVAVYRRLHFAYHACPQGFLDLLFI